MVKRGDLMRRDFAGNLWAWYRLRTYQFQAIWDRQQGLCAICGISLRRVSERGAGPRTSQNDVMVIDHDHCCTHRHDPTPSMVAHRKHKSCADCVRGLLCRRCNIAIGFLEDPAWLRQAVTYLQSDLVVEILTEGRIF